MATEQIGQALSVQAFYTLTGVGVTGLTVTVDVYRAGTKIVTDGVVTELAGGLYAYTLAAGSVTVAGIYTFIFKTASTGVDSQQLVADWEVGNAWVEYLDAPISSRLAAGGSATYTGPVPDTGDTLTLYIDTDYLAATYNAVSWVVDPPYSLVGASVVLTLQGQDFAGSVDAPSKTLSFDLTRTQMKTLTTGSNVPFQVLLTLAGGYQPAPSVEGIASVKTRLT